MSSVLLEIKNNVAFITLNRPEKINSFNREMSLLLQKKLDECAASKEIRCVYITGNGKGFCAGQDLTVAADPQSDGLKKILSEQYNPLVKKIRELQKPVVAAVNGVAAGAGANMALCCDVVIANKSANFIQAFSKIGLIPDCGGTYFLPRLVGLQKAAGLMMLADKIDATEAERIGMIYKVFEDTIFEEQSKKIAYTLAQLPTQGLWLTKKALNETYKPYEAQLMLEDELQQQAASTKDFKEGIQSFLEKRQPNFKGE